MTPKPLTTAPRKPSKAARFRRHFMTGLVILAPVWLTVYLVLLAVRLLGGLLSPLMRALASSLGGHSRYAPLMTSAADVVAFLLTVTLIAVVGFAVNRVMGRRLMDAFDALLRRIPFVREVYGGIRKVADVLFGDKTGFQRVVAVRFPTETAWSLGFVTSDYVWKIPEDTEQAHTVVFVPTTPNVTTGFLLLCKNGDFVPLSLTVDEAMKVIISVGTLTPERIQTLAESPPARG
ncbi:MAG: DUF502 domain-containing protein [bacterium]|nr:DUF502 domain-containing protein [bacterium]